MTGRFNYLKKNKKWGRQFRKAFPAAWAKASGVRNLLPMGKGKRLRHRTPGESYVFLKYSMHSFTYTHPDQTVAANITDMMRLATGGSLRLTSGLY